MQTSLHTQTKAGSYELNFKVGLDIDCKTIKSTAWFGQSSSGTHDFNVPQNFKKEDFKELSPVKIEELRAKYQEIMDAEVKAFHAEMEEISRCFMRDVEFESELEKLK